MKKKVGMYIRVSSSKQAQEGDSLEGQRYRIKEYAKNNDMSIVQEYSDTGSGYNRNIVRPGLEQLFSDISHGVLDVSAILIYKYSRFARDVVKQESKIRELETCGVELISITEPMPSSQNMGKIVRVLTGAMNENQRRRAESFMLAINFQRVSTFTNRRVVAA
jgi:site-specific DNA recombinase